ncbi:hypothetical protein [Variovorax ginsengisoli]|uniref:Transmembrane protein n=1 Tax=Variovorax ginsengisoli TaxID=363844 RepID=A0ABT8RYY1_9BURK|nr:hypothetical protein [Variovorax ginsengisoli]MDN8612600.1 hypothetical protein [Variovorax ginsengisoli]MDO1531770.1 hypothetical protein [Variovorax ginsengisoli]
MKPIKTLLSGIAIVAGVLVPLSGANAWIAAAGGWRGGAVAVGGYHPYHPYYRPAGCYGCGAAAGAVAGMAVGAAIADSYRPAVVVQQPAVVVPPPVYVTQSNLPLGTQVAALPGGARSMVVNGVNFYQFGSTWYKPYFGSSGVYYEVVPAP